MSQAEVEPTADQAGPEAEAKAAPIEEGQPPTVEGEVVEGEVVEDADSADAATDAGAADDNADDAGQTLDDVVFMDAGQADLRQTVAALEARLKAVSAAYKAQVEEVEATKARLGRQAAYKEERRRGEVVGTFFEPVENLRRAMEVVRKAAGDDAASGLDLVLHQFMDAFKKLGLEEVPGKGARFDPNLHEALTMMPVTDPALDGVVVEVFDTGYRIGTNLLKPARVIVGQLQEGVGEA